MWKVSILLFSIASTIGGINNGIRKNSDFVSRPIQWDGRHSNCLNQSKSPFCEISTSLDDNETNDYLTNYKTKGKYLQPISNVSDPPRNPFLPLFVGFQGYSIQSSRQFHGLESLVQMARNIGRELDDPDIMVGSNTLTNFNIMVGLIRTMSEMQLANATTQLYIHLDDKADSIGYLTWGVFRDAVVQAGAGPSMATLLKWIQTDLITGEEAAQLVSTLTNTAEYPTEEFIQLFFELVKITDISSKIYVNSSAVLAFGSLIKKVYICHKSMHNRFPVYSFGKPVSKHSNALNYVYFPYLIDKFKQAVNSGDSHKIQVYIRAVGNTAHPRILDEFKPYLYGQKKISNFQRLLMVASLDSMTVVHPKLARPVLYRIYRNLGETPEIRTMAVALIMRTNPPVVMLQRMAEATNWDSSEQVNAAVKTAIESAAESQSELGNNAKTVVNLLTTKSYGLHYSSNYIRSFMSENKNLGYSLRWNHIQSTGSIFPSSSFFTLRPILGGFSQRAYKYSWMSTSTYDLMKLLSNQILWKDLDHNQTNSGSTWTHGNVARMLGVQPEDTEQVEGNVFFTLQGARRFITFDNHTIEELPKLVKFASSAFRIGDNFNYTKVYNQFSLRIAFPTATGLPFVLTLEAPTVISVVGEARYNTHPDLVNGSLNRTQLPQSLNLTSDFKAVFSTKTEAMLGFVTPFSNKHYLVGYDTNVHINLPLRIKVDGDFDNQKFWTKIQPLYPNKYQKIVEYSTTAYTTRHDILELSPPQMDEHAQIIHIRHTNKFFRSVGHHLTGFAFDLKGEAEHDHLDIASIIEMFSKPDILSAIMFLDKRKSIDPFSNFNICFNPHRTTAKFAKFIVNYADIVEYATREEHDTSQSNEAIPSVGMSEHKKRVDQLLKRSIVGMRDSYAQAIDIAVDFEGETSAMFRVTAAYARSQVSEKARYLLFLAKEPAIKSQNMKPLQVALDAHIKIPNVPLGNFREAIKSDTNSAIIARLNFGEKALTGAEVTIKGHLEKSTSRINYLKNLPLAILCEKQMNDSNYFLQACHNVTTRANFMDQYYFRIDYQNVTDSWKKAVYNVYSRVRHLAYPFANENALIQNNTVGRIELDILFSTDLSSLNAMLVAPTFSSQFKHVHVNKYFQPALVFHPEFSVWDRIFERIVLSGNKPRCVVDDTYAVTFDNVTYPIFTGRCWHTLVHFYGNTQLNDANKKGRPNRLQDFSLLIRETEWKQRDLMIILGEDIIKFQSTSGIPNDYFTANEKKHDVTREVMGHFEDKSGRTLIRAYKLPTGTVKIYTPVHGLVLLYDGLRIEIQAPSQYRGKVYGLCGSYDGEKLNDFITPKKCVLRNPLEFAATYAITDGSCLGPAKELKHTAQNAPCYEPNGKL